MSVSVLMVAEKPSICNAIAAALCHGQPMDSHGRSPPVHEFEGSFLGRRAHYKVTSVTGHVFSVDFPSSYQNWDSVDPVELFSAPVVNIAEGKGGIVKHLERESRDVDYLVLWLDCDREGENICFEVIRCVEKSMKVNRDGKQNIFRAKFSAITPKDIEKAMSSLGSPNENESKAVEARQELDLKIGVAFSRFQTKYFQGKYGDLDSSVISYGPCQTPTLGFCVDRFDDIQTFSPESFWCVDVKIDVGMGTPVSIEWARGRLFDQSAADLFLHLVGGDNQLTCTSVKESETKKTRPQPMNTVEMLKIASSRLGIGPHAAMRAAEELYLSGYLSYPRTESTQYPSSFDIKDAVRTQISNSDRDIQICARALLGHGGHFNPRSGKDMGDHPPITPVGVARDISGDKARLYDLVVRHFLATVSEDALFISTKVTLWGPNSGEEFILMGQREIRAGFLDVYGRSDKRTKESFHGYENPDEVEEDDDLGSLSNLPEFRAGQMYRVATTKLRQGQTCAPGHITESELISLMEKHGIGTDASIATHINNIVVRNYVTLGVGRTLIPTTLGVVLVHGYLRIDPALVLPDVRAAIESFCNLIAKGEADKDQVVEHSLNNFRAKYQYFCQNIVKMDSLFEASFSPLAATGKFLSRCGKCLHYMRYIPLKPQRL
jgi:DNA topoisomerase-3